MTVWAEAANVERVTRRLRRILRLTERDMDRRGQQLTVPEVELDAWTTGLGAGQVSADKRVALDTDLGRHQQFHAEFKTDLDLARLPLRSGRFKTVQAAEDGDRQLLGFVCRAQVLGFDAVRTETHPADAVAPDDASVYMLLLCDLLTRAERSPARGRVLHLAVSNARAR